MDKITCKKCKWANKDTNEVYYFCTNEESWYLGEKVDFTDSCECFERED